jgi:hypothetical protein
MKYILKDEFALFLFIMCVLTFINFALDKGVI